MDYLTYQTIVAGDGILTIPIEEDFPMNTPVDLSPNVANQLLTESVGSIQANSRDGRNIATAAMGSLQAGVARAHNELGPVESRAVSGVMATPVAAPSTPSGN